MNFEQAKEELGNGKLVTRKSFPTGTVLVQQGGYSASLDKWSDRTPLTKEVLTSLGITDAIEILPHVDIVTQFKQMECGYNFTPEDIRADDWQVYEPSEVAENSSETPQGDQSTATSSPAAQADNDEAGGSTESETTSRDKNDENLAEPSGTENESKTEQS